MSEEGAHTNQAEEKLVRSEEIEEGGLAPPLNMSRGRKSWRLKKQVIKGNQKVVEGVIYLKPSLPRRVLVLPNCLVLVKKILSLK